MSNTSKEPHPLIAATRDGNHNEVQSLLQQEDIDVNAANDSDGTTALMVAATNGFEQIAVTLLDNGANVNAKNAKGSTALMCAAHGDHRGLVDLLARRGGDVNAHNDFGNTALMAATFCNHLEMVELLLTHKANINAANSNGSTALMAAADVNRTSIAKLLLDKGVDPNALRNDGQTALSIARMKKHTTIAQLITSKIVGKVGSGHTGFFASIFGVRSDSDGARPPFDWEDFDWWYFNWDFRHSKATRATATTDTEVKDAPAKRQVCIVHDISKGYRLIEPAESVTIRFTNSLSLSTIPCIHELPSFVHRVEFDSSCDCITSIAALEDQENIEDIGFLERSSGLKHVDISACASLGNFGPKFLAYCTRLETVTFPSVADRDCNDTVVDVKDEFMTGCEAVKDVDLSYFSNMSSIPSGFLSHATSLDEVDLRAFDHLVSVQHSFLYDCTGLRTVLLKGKLFSIGDYFLHGCHNLQSIDVSSPSCSSSCNTPTNEVRSVGSSFLSCCNSLRSVNLAFLSEITEISYSFMAGCTALEEVDFSPLANVCEIGFHFMAGCTSLTTADVSSFTKLKAIEAGFLKDCTKLRVVLSPPVIISGLRVGRYCLAGCPSLELVDCRFMTNLKKEEQQSVVGGSDPTNIEEIIMKDCDSSTLKVIVAAAAATEAEDGLDQPFVRRIPEALRTRITECEIGDALPQLQWSWKQHHRHPAGVQLGVLWMFAGLEHGASKDDEMCCLPAEVAHEICRFIGTPFTEVAPSESTQS